jgi:hypothetical protein
MPGICGTRTATVLPVPRHPSVLVIRLVRSRFGRFRMPGICGTRTATVLPVPRHPSVLVIRLVRSRFGRFRMPGICGTRTATLLPTGCGSHWCPQIGSGDAPAVTDGAEIVA